jgi:hypothetical protein
MDESRKPPAKPLPRPQRNAAPGAPTVPFQIDENSYSLAELDEIETLGGLTFTQLKAEPNAATVRFIRAVAYVTLRRSKPRITWEDTGEWKLKDLTEAMGIPNPPA